jgi:hypothetical protein
MGYAGLEKFRAFNFKYFMFNDNVRELKDVDEYSAIGRVEFNLFANFITQNKGKYLILSDGNFTVNRKSLTWRDAALFPVAVGCDCNKSTLKTLSANGTVYNADSIITTINDLCFGG